MRTKGILFSTPMVRAILDGIKTQTRRSVKPKYCDSVFEMHQNLLCETEPPTPAVKLPDGRTRHKVRQFVPCKSRYDVGDILYVRETWLYDGINLRYVYKADEATNCAAKWKPSIHMPKSAARIFLRVTNVRCERLNDISNCDAKSEGVEATATKFGGCSVKNPGIDRCHKGCNCFNSRENFAGLWDSINAKRGYSWDSNPWVWVYEFEHIEKPTD